MAHSRRVPVPALVVCDRYVEAWDEDSTGSDQLGWGVVELAKVLTKGAGVAVPVVVSLNKYDKKGVAHPTGKVSLTVKFDVYVGDCAAPAVAAT